MKQPKYKRNNKTITDLATKQKTVYKFINEAKRASREIQIREDGGLGRGTLKRVN